MVGKTGTLVLIRKRSADLNPAFDYLVERLRRMGRDVIIVEADESIFPNIPTIEKAAEILEEIDEIIKKRFN